MYNSKVVSFGDGFKYRRLNIPKELIDKYKVPEGQAVFKEDSKVLEPYYGINPKTGKPYEVIRLVVDILA